MAEAPDNQLCGYRLLRQLAPGRTWLGELPAGRRVVLKLLESDCLLGKDLHPLIRDRLNRVRELAHLGVANLYGVQRQADQAYLEWEYVDGVTLEEHLARGQQAKAGVAHPLARELRNSVESLHTLGIVHGALHERNVLLTPDGRVMLTHISPLLYSDPQVDLDALEAMLAKLDTDQPETEASPSPDIETGEKPSDRRARRWAIWGATLTALAGLLIAWAVWKWASRETVEQAGTSHVSGP